jgi:hypothetical protein
MNSALQIAVDLEQGEIRLGTERVRLLPVAGDVFCLNDARGPLVRALKFEERARLLSDAGDRDVASLVADAALVSPGVASDVVRIAASLALAGGGEEAPAFFECAQFVEQQYGWDEKRVAESMALVIDRLCSRMVQQDGNGWKQIVLQKSDADLGSLISQMAANLSQRAVASDGRVSAEPQTAQRKNSPSTSHQQFCSTNSSGFDSQTPSPSSRGSVQSVSSALPAVLPVRRAPFRVLAVNTDQATHTQPGDVVASAAPDSTAPDVSTLSFPKLDQVATPQIKFRAAAMSTSAPTITQNTDSPPILKPQTNHADFSLSQPAAARTELLSGPATFPTWQPFTTSVPETRPSSEPARISSRAFAVAVPESRSSQDWLAEVAQLLEAECDMRGIDP